MGIIADLIIVGFLILFVALGYKKGLTGSLIKLASFAIALVLAFMLYKPVANVIIDNTQIDENIKKTIVETFSKQEEKENQEDSSISNSIMGTISNQIESGVSEAKSTIVENTATETTKTIINIGSGIMLFIVARLLLVIVSFFIKGITSLPIIKQLDKTGGIAYGLVEGIVIIYIVLALISFTSLIWNNNIIVEAIDKSSIGSMLYNNNLILKILFK